MAKKKKKKGDDEKLKKKKPSRAVEEDEDEIEEEPEEEDPTIPKRRQDIFVGLSFLSLAFLITAAAFYNQDAEDMTAKPFAQPEVSIPALTGVSDKVK